MPIKIMLVDDEIIVRLGMKSVIDWEANGFRHVGEACDGREALALLEQVQPDILLTDIKMPNMNGIELIELVKRSYPWIRILVLSSHDEYDFVRSAMKLGADDYILKASVDPDKLIRLLQETASRIVPHMDRKPENANGQRDRQPSESGDSLEDALRRCVDGKSSPADLNRAEMLERFDSKAAYVVLARTDEESAGGPLAASSVATLANVLELNARKWADASLVRSSEKEAVLILWMQSTATAEQLREIGADLTSAAERFVGAAIDVGISVACGEPIMLQQAYAQSELALDGRFYESDARVHVYGEHNEDSQTTDKPLFTKQEEEELALAVERLDEEGIKRLIGLTMAKLRSGKQPIASTIQICLDLFYCLQSAFRRFGDSIGQASEKERPAYSQMIEFKRIGEAERWFDAYVAQCLETIRSTSRERVREDILALKAYLKTHYTESFTLKQAAEMTNISEGYLSYLFKKETGSGLIEYMNGLRVEKAAELLRETHLPSYAIAEKVGYDNINYFGRIFKKVKGMSPKRYRANYSAGSTTSIPLE
ncbi:response regulator transcription factor [Cohnella mopanensis]|uniref:response regulator transcription factor n=1 Tax=Cohnella mopanensis TaxID=2911966 RepID=UPI001EF81BCA|nr:response regulator [Cohnella mopanensis]